MEALGELQWEENRESWLVSADVVLLGLVLLLAATALLPSGAATTEDCEWSESGQELLTVLFHAMRFTSCGGTETHNGWSAHTWMDNRGEKKDGWATHKMQTVHAAKQERVRILEERWEERKMEVELHAVFTLNAHIH